MKEIRIKRIVKVILGLLFLVGGITFCIFSTNNIMELFLSYFIASLIVLGSFFLIVYTFIKTPEHIFRYFIYSLSLSFGIYCLIDTSITTSYFSLYIGITMMLFALLYFLKFIILKKVPLNYWFNLAQLIICIIVFAIGLIAAIFFMKINTFLISLIFGIPLIIVGAILLFLNVLRLIVNR